MSMIPLHTVCYGFGLGALGSASSVFTFWLLGKFASDWGFMFRDLTFDMFYGPMFWGGVVAWGMFLPLKMPNSIQVALCAAAAAFMHIFMMHEWLNVRFFHLLSVTDVLQKTELSLMLTYLVVWSATVSFASRTGSH